MSSATGIAGPIKNITFPSPTPDHAALFVEFATEAQHQVNRLVHCALENSVGLEPDMKIGSTTENMGTVARVMRRLRSIASSIGVFLNKSI